MWVQAIFRIPCGLDRLSCTHSSRHERRRVATGYRPARSQRVQATASEATVETDQTPLYSVEISWLV